MRGIECLSAGLPTISSQCFANQARWYPSCLLSFSQIFFMISLIAVTIIFS
jgi:hypothetical protein